MTDFVVAIIATYGRPKELSRLLASLEEIKESLGAVIVVDNAGATEVQTLVGKAKCNTHYFSPKKNLGSKQILKTNCFIFAQFSVVLWTLTTFLQYKQGGSIGSTLTCCPRNLSSNL